MMFCPNCGREIQQGMKFCQHCGTAVDQPDLQIQGAPQEPKVAGRKIWPIVLALVIALILLVVVLVVVLIKVADGQSAKQNTSTEEDLEEERRREKKRISQDEAALEEVKNATVIACSVDKIYIAVCNAPGSTATVTIADGEQVTSNCDELTEEVLLVIPDAINFRSKKYKGTVQTVTVTIESGTGIPTFTNSWGD